MRWQIKGTAERLSETPEDVCMVHMFGKIDPLCTALPLKKYAPCICGFRIVAPNGAASLQSVFSFARHGGPFVHDGRRVKVGTAPGTGCLDAPVFCGLFLKDRSL